MLSLIGNKPVGAAHDSFVAWFRRCARRGCYGVACGLLSLTVAMAAASSPGVRGVPFTRSYSLEDIGYGPRGARLGFDRFGRVAVIHDGVYAVLNDTTWLSIAARRPERIQMSNVVTAADGLMYYGARASWGLAEIRADGMLHAVSLVPADAPDWIRSAAFSDLITTEDGVYFISPNGVVFRDARSGETQFHEHPRIVRAFQVGKTVYLSAFQQKLYQVDIQARVTRAATEPELSGWVVELSTPLDEKRSLVALVDGRLAVFDGQRLQAWEAQQRHGLDGRVSAILRLVDGNVAVAITGKGLFLLSEEGELLLLLNALEYQRITALANREPGVLWVATEDGIEKVLYSSALTAFGQQLGLTVGWPIIERWQGSILVASDGGLYQAKAASPGTPSRFELYPVQPDGGVWGLAAWDSRLLVAGPDRVYALESSGTLRPVAEVRDMAHLVMFDADHCYAIGRTEIALLEWRDGGWTETVPRTQGVTYPSVVHRVKDSVWIEMGGQVGRLWLRDGQPQLDLLPNAEWTGQAWVNIGAVEDIVVLSARPGERRFFDEGRGEWCDAPELRALLERSPFWIARVENDEAGTIWATHDEGVVRFTPNGNGFDLDAGSFDLINDRYPVLRVLPGNDVWIFSSRSLYHVEQRWVARAGPAPQPMVVSLIDRHGEELLTDALPEIGPIRLPFAKNTLSFRFFSGSYAGRRAPTYEYRMSEQEPWTTLAGSQLSFRGLREGEYRLEVRTLERYGASGAAAIFPFEIRAPWYRTWPAYVLFGSAMMILLVGVTRWASYLERKRSRVLEQVVHERTRQLEDTMARLGEETRNAATLAERDRLANEIHDSVQQGLTGAILQLDTTLKLPTVGGDVRSRLNVVRNMVSYARQEVQHAVWDMESPLLEGTELGDALRNLTTFINADDVTIDVRVEGAPVPLGRSANHNLLRIAQEATTNAFRHARAHRISLQLEYRGDAVSLVIADDGIGFRPSEVLQDRAGHLGLRGIRTRVKRLGGTLAIDSVPNQGTSIRIVVPLPADDVQENGMGQ